MRRRPPPKPEHVWSMADMPPHLKNFDPVDWGCFTAAQWQPEWQQARAEHRRAQQQWIADHDVHPLKELQVRRAARLAEQGRIHAATTAEEVRE